jgi:hypothetical protein
MNFPQLTIPSRPSPGQSAKVKSIRKYFSLLLIVVGSLAASKTANAQSMLLNYASGLCAGITGANYQLSTGLILWSCNPNDYSQIWLRGDQTAPGYAGTANGLPAKTLESASFLSEPQFGTFVIDLGTVGAFDNYRLPDGTLLGAQDGQVRIDFEVTPVNVNNPQSGDYQGWVFVPNGSVYYQGSLIHCYYIANAGATGPDVYYLGVSGGSRSEGAPVVSWVDTDPITNHPDQTWCWAPSAL